MKIHMEAGEAQEYAIIILRSTVSFKINSILKNLLFETPNSEEKGSNP